MNAGGGKRGTGTHFQAKSRSSRQPRGNTCLSPFFGPRLAILAGLAAALAGLPAAPGRAADAPPTGQGSVTTSAPAAAGPHVEVTLAPTEVAVGDHVQATLTLRLPGAPTVDPLFPDWQRGWGKAEVLAAPPVARRADGTGTLFVQQLTLAAFEPGEVVLPPMAVELPGDGQALTPDGLRLAVRSVLPKDDQQPEPRPPAPPLPLGWGPIFWWTLAGLAGLCLAAGALAGQRRRAAGESATIAATPPLPELLAALTELGGEAQPERGFARLSLAVRRYLGRRLGFHGSESSTSEIQRELAGRRLAPPLVRRTVALLRDCDQVKFARRPAELAALTTQMAAVRELAAAVEEHLAPPPPPPPAPAAEARP